jgi:hypothetical protein
MEASNLIPALTIFIGICTLIFLIGLFIQKFDIKKESKSCTKCGGLDTVKMGVGFYGCNDCKIPFKPKYNRY